MEPTEVSILAHDTFSRTVLRIRDGELQVTSTISESIDAILTVLLLFSLTLLPVLMRVRILYTFCWAIFSVLAFMVESEVALGIATSLGLTIMMGWYTVRLFDRTTFMGILQGWFGSVSEYRCFQLLANSVDLILHMGVPLMLAFYYLPLVRIWMTAPILLFSKLWIKLVAGGDLCLTGNDVYHFAPPRPKRFWLIIRKIEMLYNFIIPTLCVITHHAGVHNFVVTYLLKLSS
ncbi:hypothetical protein PsorP6_004376 [Peronosclerospora sorghi]|uniref:Uncharacterized protein n=1 Tax=Peronosclerospora sorghi TaxID=230839 RepID=A0ACC0VPX7_9STRA|nr:hypothetical protein PsorP6_004376 [Peronosclerospora sorghi]